MKATITVEVPDEFIAQRTEECNRDFPDEPEDTPESFFVGRLKAISEDELPIALFGWPAEFEVQMVVEE